MLDFMAFQFSTLAMLDSAYAAAVGEHLREYFQKSSILEAVLAFPDLDLFKINDLEGLAELEIDGPYDFDLNVMVEDNNPMLIRFSDYNLDVLAGIYDLCEERDWFPYIHVFAKSECREAGGLIEVGYSTHSQRKHRIYQSEM